MRRKLSPCSLGCQWSITEVGQILDFDHLVTPGLEGSYDSAEFFDPTGYARNSLLVIPAEMEKGNQDRLLPMAPEFARFLEETPEADRQGPVFKFHNRKSGKLGTVKMQWASTVICDIGEQARVVVNKKSGKFASAHDLRRAFGQRWAAKVMPQILMQLMRHRDISTTMKYYVGSEAETTANVLWEADEKPRGQKVAI